MALGFDGSVDGLRVFTDLSQPKEEMHTGVGVAAVVRVGWYMVRTGWDSLSFLGGLLGQLRQLLIAIRVRGIQQVGRQFGEVLRQRLSAIALGPQAGANQSHARVVCQRLKAWYVVQLRSLYPPGGGLVEVMSKKGSTGLRYSVESVDQPFLRGQLVDPRDDLLHTVVRERRSCMLRAWVTPWKSRRGGAYLTVWSCLANGNACVHFGHPFHVPSPCKHALLPKST